MGQSYLKNAALLTGADVLLQMCIRDRPQPEPAVPVELAVDHKRLPRLGIVGNGLYQIKVALEVQMCIRDRFYGMIWVHSSLIL